MRAQGFGYSRSSWAEWVSDGKAPAIAPVRELYRKARALGVKTVFITGRRERDRPGTEKNLRAIGCGEYDVLIFKPDATAGTTVDFKRAARIELEKRFTIIANIGDQESDLAGGHAEKTFKLPNPFYLSR
jgi:acid phosphatase